MNIRTLIENYLAILTSNEGAESDRIQKLILSLDELALVSNKVDYTFDKRDYPEPPEKDYKASCEGVGKLFPSLGSCGHAMDDIMDIANDLTEVLWRYENTSEDDALFHFQLLFRSHWGRHLRSLQFYLHDFYW